MKKIRKIAAGVLVVSMLFSVLPIQSMGNTWMLNQMVTAEAAEEEKESGDYRYAEKADGTITITGYKGNKKYVSIPETIEGKKVTEIGKNAFRNKQEMVRVKISENVTDIDDEAFANCNNLLYLTLPDNLTKIGNYAFCMCNKLKNVVIPERVEQIGDGAFFYCNSMSYVTMKANPTMLGSYIFSDCSSLTFVELPEDFKEVAEGMFFCCEELRSVSGATELEKIGERAFRDCYRLKLKQLDNLKEIGDYALSYIGDLENVTILTENVGEGAFYQTSVDTMTIEDSVQKEDAFLNAEIETMILGEDVDSSIRNSIRKATVNDFDVATDNANLTEFQDSLYNKNKTELVKYHAVEIFYLDEEAEEDNNSFELPEGIKRIGDYACYGYQSRDKLILPESIQEIGEGAFNNAVFLEVKIPDSVRKIEENAFCENAGLQTVKIGSNVEEIADEAFFGCKYLSNVEGGENVTEIGEFAFAYCNRLEEFTISNKLDELGDGAFEKTNIKEFHVAESQPNYKAINGSLVTKDGKKLLCIAGVGENEELVFPEGITTLMPYSLSGLRMEKDIEVPEGVTNIEEKAIAGSDEQEITLPDSIQKIGEKAIGYSFDKNGGATLSSRVFIYSENEAAQDYAEDNDIAIATAKTDINNKKIELKGDETFQVEVPGLLKERTYYSSTDNEIASVSDAGVITAHKTGKTYVTVYTADVSWYTEVTVTSDGTPYISSYDVSSYVHPMDDEKAWCEAYMEENDMNGFLEEENPNTVAYSGYEYVPMKALLEHGQEYVPRAINRFGENYKRYEQLNINLNYELSKYTLPMDTLFYSGIRTVKNLTGKSDSVKDMRASIGKTGVYNCITSTSYDHSVSTGFMYSGRGNAMLELYLPKGYNKGAYISQYSQFKSEKEYLMATGFKYKVLDAGVRTYQGEDEDDIQTERFMKLLIIPDEKETEPEPVVSEPDTNMDTSTETNTNANTADNVNTTPLSPEETVTKEKAIQKTVNGVVYEVSGQKVVVVKARKSIKKVSIPSRIKIKGKIYKVKAIKANAFKNCKKLKKISLGNNLLSIGKNAFKNINAKATFKMNKKYYKKYKKLLTKKTGYKKTMKLEY